MAAALLRHYSNFISSTSVATLFTIPTSRALAISKVLVSASGSSNVTLLLGTNYLCVNLALTAGQVYTETGLVGIAAETFQYQASTSNVLTIHVFGEEVDN